MEKFSPSSIKKLASIGCGVSNLSFLYSCTLSDNITIDLFEKEKRISGRASTRKRNGYIYDLGANYISSSSESIKDLLENKLNKDDLITIDKWIYPFDKDNKISFTKTQETNKHNRLTKYNYKYGINTISSLLLKHAVLPHNLNFSSLVTSISQVDNNRWELFSTNDTSLGTYDYITFGIPVPQIASIFANSKFNSDNDKEYYVRELQAVEYKPVYSVAVAFEPKIEMDFYALINSDREHDISWVSVETEKKGRTSGEKENFVMFIVQMSENFSKDCFNLATESINKRVIEKLKALLPQLNEDNVKVSYVDSKLWKYALPKKGISSELIQKLNERNIFILGDSLLGKGRVDGSILTGFELHNYLKRNSLI